MKPLLITTLLVLAVCIKGRGQTNKWPRKQTISGHTFVLDSTTSGWYWYREGFPEDTLPNKKIKNLDKMKPRWEDSLPFGTAVSPGRSVTAPWTVGAEYFENTKPLIDYPSFITTPSDTLKAIFLVSDTSVIGGFRSQRVYWMFGLVTYGNRHDLNMTGDEEIKYMDVNKERLSNNIVVWMSKEVK